MAAKLFFHANHSRPSVLIDHKSTPQEHARFTSHPCNTTIRLHRRIPLISTFARGDRDNDTNSDASSPTPSDENSPPLSSPSSGSDPRPAVIIRYRSRGEKRRQRKRPEAPPPPPPPKTWDEMTLAEKTAELYMGEKGILFWLNKFAYASIFIVIGGWILFRFVGPALNLYQLDAPPLPPSDIFKSSKT